LLGNFSWQLYSKSGFIFLAEIDQFFKMNYSAVSQAAKRFEQKSKVNHEIGEIKQKMMAALKEN